MNNIEVNPLVTIITVVYNGEATIEKTIISVLNQSYINIEYIIVDGKSTDSTLNIINRYKSSISSIISETDNGISDAMNKGIKNANGTLVGIINADDWLELNTIEIVVAAFLQNPNAVIHGDLKVHTNLNDYYISKGPTKPNLIKGMEINHPTAFVPLDLYKKHGYFNEDLKIVFDWEFILRLHLCGIKFKNIPNILANFTLGGVSTKYAKNIVYEMHCVRKKYKLYKFYDYYFIINRIRLLLFGSNMIKISQYKRLIKFKLFNN
jgi:glycosyltransferase involved in cell wall biosynthesis